MCNDVSQQWESHMVKLDLNGKNKKWNHNLDEMMFYQTTPRFETPEAVNKRC